MSELINPESYPSYGKKTKKIPKGPGNAFLLSEDGDIRGPIPGPKVEIRQPVNDTSNLRMVNAKESPHEKKDPRHDL